MLPDDNGGGNAVETAVASVAEAAHAQAVTELAADTATEAADQAEQAASDAANVAAASVQVTAEMLSDIEGRLGSRLDDIGDVLGGITTRLNALEQSATAGVSEVAGAAENAANDATGALSEIPSETVEEADRVTERRRRYRRI